MLKVAIVIFREFLEISLLLGVILAATRGLANRLYYVVAGIMIGVVGASFLAFFTRLLNRSFHGIGDEIFDASVIFITVALLVATAIWVNNPKEIIKNKVDAIILDLDESRASKVMLTLLISGTIFREGSEIVLFLYSIARSVGIEGQNYVAGIGIGILSGSLCGWALYIGLLKWAGRYIFKISFFMLSFISAGLASEAVGILSSVGLLDSYRNVLWDSSSFVTDDGMAGKILKILVGYEAKPTGMQVIAYVSTLLVILLGSSFVRRGRAAKASK
ncbi:MAG: FTR1 family protein [Rickettsiaceae bacterium]|nr:FTR1 family protein [Rickettsiaceae bacterium]